jgi:uncharacterized protein YcaQ
MAELVIDKAQARRFVLGHLGLLPPRKLSGKQGVLEFIRRVNCIQYDPINVVGQNSHLVLQSRVRNYMPSMLQSLLYEDHKLVDGFDKQMSIYPVEDWPDFAYYRKSMSGEYGAHPATQQAMKLVNAVKADIKKRGPLSSLELEDDTRIDWWLSGSARAVRIALDMLVYRGDIVVHHRVGTRRYFDLAERVLPAKVRKASRVHKSHLDYLDWHVFRRAGGIGLIHARSSMEYGGLTGWQGGAIKTAVRRLVEQGRMLEVKIEDVAQSFYVRAQDLPALKAAAKPSRGKLGASLIAPLDNLMWNRYLDSWIFDFDYVWEVYVPEPKRKHGYYVMPVLVGERLVARMDPSFDRETKVFGIKNWWWEAGVNKKDEAMLAVIQECLTAFGRYLGAKGVGLGPKVQREPGLKRAAAAASRELR